MGNKKNFANLRDLTSVGLSSVIGAAILSIFWIFLASILSPEEYGEISYYIAIANIASVIAFLGAGQTITVYTAKEVNVQSATYVITLIASVVTSVSIYFILSNIEISLFISLYIFGYVIFGLVTQEALGRKMYGNYSKYLVAQRFLIVILAMSFYLTLGTYGIIFGYGLASLPYSIILYKNARKTKLDFSALRSKIGFVINSYGRDLSKILSRTLDKILIFPLFGFAALGHYQLGYQVFMALSLLPLIIFQYTLPRESSGLENKKLNRITIIVASGLTTLVILVGPFIMPILFPNFVESVQVIQIMSFALIPLSISLMFNSKFLALEKSRYVIIGSITFLAIQVIGIFTFGKIFGINGVAFATLLGAIAEAVYLSIVNYLKFRKPT
jgi:O-antigen/teichoic acid export membrane protein